MKKLNSTIYRGIEYIRLGSLPDKQRNQFLNWLDVSNIITIQVNGTFQSDCVQYSEYSYWFEQVFMSDKDNEQYKQLRRTKNTFNLAFNKGDH